MPKIMYRPNPVPPPFVPPVPPVSQLIKIFIKQASWQRDEEMQIKPTAINLDNVSLAIVYKTVPSSEPIEIIEIDQESFNEGVYYFETMFNAGSISDDFFAQVTFNDSSILTVPATFQLDE